MMAQGNNSSLNGQIFPTSSDASQADTASINASRLRNGGGGEIRARNSATKVVINTNTESTL